MGGRMKIPAAADLQKLSEEVARDPSSLAFLPLARAYRRQGHRDAALRLCLRGLAQHPTNAEAHGLLALLYLEAGDRQRAFDEWSIVLTLDSTNFDAQRGIGFYYLERHDVPAARRHLERAALQRPEDPAVREALALLREQDRPATEPWSSPAPAAPVRSTTPPAPAAPPRSAAAPPAATRPAAPARVPDGAPPPRPVAMPQAAAPAPVTRDPLRLFEPLLGEGPFLGALLLDPQGLVLAGTLAEESGAEALGAVIGGAIDEAARAAGLLALGRWRGILLETRNAVLHLSPLSDRSVVLLAARRGAPAGWVLRTAARAADLSRRFLQEAP
jgi:tetratricopeptide (TPR) repeat protein